MSNTISSLEVLIRLARFQAAVTRKFDRLSAHGLNFNDLLIIHVLKQAPKEKMRRVDLAEKLGVTASGITRMLIPMEKMGWINRESDTRDARIAYAVLTSAGKQLYKDAIKTANYIAEDIIPKNKLSAHPVSQLLNLLNNNN